MFSWLELSFLNILELVVVQAISDGAIDAGVDHDGSFVKSKESGDIYASVEPQAAFHSRIAFCLNINNEAIKANSCFSVHSFCFFSAHVFPVQTGSTFPS